MARGRGLIAADLHLVSEGVDQHWTARDLEEPLGRTCSVDMSGPSSGTACPWGDAANRCFGKTMGYSGSYSHCPIPLPPISCAVRKTTAKRRSASWPPQLPNSRAPSPTQLGGTGGTQNRNPGPSTGPIHRPTPEKKFRRGKLEIH